MEQNNEINNETEETRVEEVLADEGESKRIVTDKFIRSLVAGSLIAGLIGGAIGQSLFSGDNNILGDSEKRVILEEDSAVIDVVEKTKPAIVSIVGTKTVSTAQTDDFFDFFFPFQVPNPTQTEPQEQEVSAGTGFFVTSDGLIATNKHVVEDTTANFKVYTNDGRKYDAQVVARDPVNDFALVKIEGRSFPTLTLGNSEDVKVGQSVIAIGNALGQYTNTVTTGVISGINRSVIAGGGQSLTPSQIEGALQTDAAINPGNSGGPLLDLAGNVVGINTAVSLQGQLIGFALPVNDWRRDIESYQRRGAIVKPYIGVRYVMITEALKDERNLPVSEGALISSGEGSAEPGIVPGGPAERANLRENDIITEVNGEKISLDRSLGYAVRNMNPGDVVDFTVLREGRRMTIKLTLGERTE